MRGFISGLVIGLIIGVVLAVAVPHTVTQKITKSTADKQEVEEVIGTAASPVEWRLYSVHSGDILFSADARRRQDVL